ncbi:MAG: hypothetical protein HY827_04445 [Actinobacteria bacterium]|nr:hypothetical protein [Actinomycetota bacterium]
MTLKLRNTRTRSWLVAVGAATSLLAFGAGEANAGVNHFCPSVFPPDIVLGAYGNCTSGRYYSLTRVGFITSNGNGVSHCAVAKWNWDGSGSNAIPAVCTTSQTAMTTCLAPGSISAYAKGTSQSPTSHHFYGVAAYSGSC